MKVLTGIAAAAVALLIAPIFLIGLAAAAVDRPDIELPDGKGRGLKGVPAAFHPWFLKASQACEHPELSPALLAAQMNQESHFNTKRPFRSPAGAEGPAQFMPGTWATWGRDDDGNGRIDPYDIGDAVMAQGRMMCSLVGQAKRSGYRDDPRRLALAGYNAGWTRVEQFKGVPPSSWALLDKDDPTSGQTYNYVRLIMASLPQFQGPTGLNVSGSGIGPNALRRASSYIGTPYSWGGGTPAGPSRGYCDGTNGYLPNGECSASKTPGFDCSSLVQYAYWPDKQLPRTAEPQYRATAHNPVAKSELRPGDLLFWSNKSGYIYHVALYAGDGKVLHAPRTGRNVQVQDMATAMPAGDYHGATRPQA
ncbi:bifunctional lytic transglycosylase/C40 family peptidase [Streptomyces sp.]|uniref:C40 family peptidase n=1 Tax=Streptomyces sp. TaxID=1931 RepID=UPI002F92857F